MNSGTLENEEFKGDYFTWHHYVKDEYWELKKISFSSS